MRNDEAERAAMFGGERFAVMGVCEKNVGMEEIGERNVGSVSFLGDEQSVFGGGSGLDELEDFGEEDAGPAIVKAAPARDAMKVRSNFGLRGREKFLPGKFGRSGDFARDLEVPLGFVEMRDRTVVENRPFQREGLAGR